MKYFYFWTVFFIFKHKKVQTSQIQMNDFAGNYHKNKFWQILNPLQLLPLDYSNRPQLDALLTDPRGVARVDHVCHVFVRLRRFLHDQFRRRHPDRDALRGKLVQDFLIVKSASWFRSVKLGNKITVGPDG